MAGRDPAIHSITQRAPRHRVGPRVRPAGDAVDGGAPCPRGAATAPL